MEHVVAPAPGWYPDPAGSTARRWWDGAVWTTYVQTAQPAPAPVGDPFAPMAPVAAPDAHASNAYAGDPRFGAVAATAGFATQPAGAVPHHATHAAPSAARPTSHVVAAAVAAVVLLVGAIFVGKSVLGGSGSATGSGATSAESSGGVGGLLVPGNPQVAAMRSDVRNIADAEETLFTDNQRYSPATSSAGTLKLAGQTTRLSAAGESVQVVVSLSGTGYCIRAARTPAGGGSPQIVVYVSTLGGIQSPAVTSCPAAF